MGCEHKRTHPSHCDDCGGLWCYVCRTYHKPTSPSVCMDALHTDRASLHTQLAARTAEVERLREALQDAIEGLLDMHPYVPEYYSEKWDHQGYIDRARAARDAALAPKEKTDG